jgi:hypothetical protein
LEAIALDAGAIQAEIAQDVADGLNYFLFFDLHHHLPAINKPTWEAF